MGMTEEQWQESILNRHIWMKSSTIQTYAHALATFSSHDILEKLTVESLGTPTKAVAHDIHYLNIKYGIGNLHLMDCRGYCTQSAESFDKASWVEYRKGVLKKELLDMTQRLQELLSGES